MQTRRRFISTLGAASLAACLPIYAGVERRRVVILGAGFSGLYSAQLLEQLGFDVLVLEARQRVGGRGAHIGRYLFRGWLCYPVHGQVAYR
jgi:ribulose 1,5-bisphosphate synthetase/thiazole synthase